MWDRTSTHRPRQHTVQYMLVRPCIICRPTDDVAGTAGSMVRKRLQGSDRRMWCRVLWQHLTGYSTLPVSRHAHVSTVGTVGSRCANTRSPRARENT